MSLVNVKCPNCGSSIQLDGNREEGFCSYCGSKVQIQEAIKQVKIDKSGDIQNYLKMSQASLDAGNGQESYDYANKALELDPDCAEGWYLRMQALGLMGILKDLKTNEIVAAGQKAIDFDSSPEMKKKVYSFFLSQCLSDYKFLMMQLQDTDSIKDLYDAHVRVSAFSATEKTLAADSIADIILGQGDLALALRLSVPNSEITNDEELSRLTGEVAKQYVYYQNAINARFNVYGAKMNDQALQNFRNNLERIKQGLPDQYKNVIDGNSMQNPSKGCYVATAVYGSYDCPEVWTLRRFRDYNLDETWYGRAFIKTYYAVSPTLVKWFGETKWFKAMWKKPLDKMVRKLNNKGYDNTPYNDKY